MALRILVPLVCFAVAGGCTNDNDNVDGPIDYRVTGGFSGGGDGTGLHVELDGTATRPKAGGGMETATLDAATLADLRGKVVHAQFATLAPMYSCNCADDFVHNVSAQIDGTAHTVKADSTAEFPERLKIVIDTLQDIRQRPLDWH